MIMTGANIRDEYIKMLEKHKENFYDEMDFINEHKQMALNRFAKNGIPEKKNEKYKYANVPEMLQKHIENQIVHSPVTYGIEDIFKCDVPGLDTYDILVVNGRYYRGNEELVEMENGIIIGSFAKAASKYPELVSKYFAGIATYDDEGLVALNTVMSVDGVFIYVPRGARLDKPLQIVNLIRSEDHLTASSRNLFVVEEHAELDLIMCDHTLSAHRHFSNNVTEVYVGAAGKFAMTKMQNEHNDASHLSHTFIDQQQDSNANVHFIGLNGGYIRNNLEITLNGENANSGAYGLAISDREQYIDNYVLVKHNKPHCESTQLYKGILDGKSEVSYTGKIYVEKDAQKTNAYQTSRNLLLSKEAKANSKPQLEIYADDVKCSHGATVGKIDQEALFYLKSRGIGHDEARFLLMFAFADEVISNIQSEALRERVRELTNDRLRGELAKCKCCALNCYQPLKN